MKVIHYNKLIRDKIPEIISDTGKTPVTATLSVDEYIKKLDDKLVEELTEYQESKEIEELADMLEVIYAIATARNISISELEQIRKNKKDKRGGFENRLLLNEVIEK